MKDYLLDRLPEAMAEQMELRLLSDPAFVEEFDIVVDEITDEYLRNELSTDERARVEKYFLSSNERQNKLAFAAELLRRAESKAAPRPGVLEQIAAFWRQQSYARVVVIATAMIVAGIIIYFATRPPATYVALNLTISTAERAEGAAAQRAKVGPNIGIRLALTIPENARGANNYAARLAGGSDLKIEQQTPETIIITIPPGSIPPGTYAIQLFKNTKERIPGSYYFAVE